MTGKDDVKCVVCGAVIKNGEEVTIKYDGGIRVMCVDCKRFLKIKVKGV